MFSVFETIAGFFAKGGIFMWPLLACSIVALTVIILRTLALREKNVLPLTIESEMERLAPGANPERLFRIVQHDSSSLARIVRVALAHLRWPRSENIEAVQTRARHEMAERDRRLEIEAQATPRPGDRGTSVPAVEAIVERDTVDPPSGTEIPVRRHSDALDRQHLRIGAPHRAGMAAIPAGSRTRAVGEPGSMAARVRRHASPASPRPIPRQPASRDGAMIPSRYGKRQ